MENLTKTELSNMFGSINSLAITLNQTRQAIYQKIGVDDVANDTLTNMVLIWCIRNNKPRLLPERFGLRLEFTHEPTDE
jgi:hypothetical protein